MKMKKILLIVAMLLSVSIASAWGEFQIDHNQTEIKDLQSILDSYHFKYQWQNDVFDCVDMSAANWKFLKSLGYSPMIAIRKNPPSNEKHVYVFLTLKSGMVGVDTSIYRGANLTASLGKVVTVLEMERVCRNPEELYAIDPRGPPVIMGDVIEKNS